MAAEELSIAAPLAATAKQQRLSKSPTSTTGVTKMEQALGELINIMNPYSNPTCLAFEEVRRMQFAAGAPAQGIAADLDARRRQIALEIDNYGGGEWTFMGQMYKIKRALLIPYRYQLLGGVNRDQETGIWPTGNLLIGYTGANG
jgi:hypothetical protein